MSYLGEIAGVATSVSWTICGLGFALASRRVGALAVNQIRIVAAVLILVTVHLALYGSPVPLDLSERQLGLLAASGLAGLALGDLFYFHCISVLGPRIGMLLMATNTLFCAGLAWPILGEELGGQALAGIALTIFGVTVVVVDPRGEPTWRGPDAGASRGWAIVAGLLGGLGQGSGLVLAKLGMFQAEGEVGLTEFSATVVRMIAGMLGILLVAAASRRLGEGVRAVRDGRAMAATTLGVVFGPTMGVWLSLVAVRHTDAGVASALSSLPPVLMIPLARIAYGARPSRIAVGGTLLAIAGTAVLFLRVPTL